MTDDPTSLPGLTDRGDYIRRLIAARIPEISAGDIALLAQPDSAVTNVLDQVMEVLGMMADRMAEFEKRLAA